MRMKTVFKKESAFETPDINLAASLAALNMPLTGIDREDPERCKFVFDNTPEVKRMVQAYWSKQLAIEPQSLLSSLKAIKSRLYGDRV